MLSELYIENIAVISSARIAFKDGFNVFTGETGAGKSILIGAIGAALGARTSKELIRTGEEKAHVKALFTKVSTYCANQLSELGIDANDGEILVEREITGDSTSCRVNGKPVTVAMLRTVGGCLIHTHGQQDSQLLASCEAQLDFIDSYGETQQLLEDYKASFAQLCHIKKRLAQIDTNQAEKARKIDLLTYQIEEIEKAELYENEEQDLIAQKNVIKNSKDILEKLAAAREALVGNDESQGAISLIFNGGEMLSHAGEYIEEISTAAEKVEGFGYELEEISALIRHHLDSLDFNPSELEEIEDRLDLINKLKRKYGSDIAEILEFLEKCKQELSEIELSDETIEILKKQLNQAENKAKLAASILTEKRVVAARELSAAVVQELKELDMPSAQLEAKLTSVQLGENGADAVEMLLSVNPGESLKPLAKIASGGEMSRIMLGIKSVLNDKAGVATMIFDEVDTGISGRAAQRVGAKLTKAAKNHQVICVTHLAQVAAFAQHHLLIEKQVKAGRTHTVVRAIESEQREQELARIMNGEPITDIAMQNARELIAHSKAITV